MLWEIYLFLTYLSVIYGFIHSFCIILVFFFSFYPSMNHHRFDHI